jgi:hypothetical protein
MEFINNYKRMRHRYMRQHGISIVVTSRKGMEIEVNGLAEGHNIQSKVISLVR